MVFGHHIKNTALIQHCVTLVGFPLRKWCASFCQEHQVALSRRFAQDPYPMDGVAGFALLPEIGEIPLRQHRPSHDADKAVISACLVLNRLRIQ